MQAEFTRRLLLQQGNYSADASLNTSTNAPLPQTPEDAVNWPAVGAITGIFALIITFIMVIKGPGLCREQSPMPVVIVQPPEGNAQQGLAHCNAAHDSGPEEVRPAEHFTSASHELKPCQLLKHLNNPETTLRQPCWNSCVLFTSLQIRSAPSRINTCTCATKPSGESDNN